VHWNSCNAGQNTVGIEADGTIKGCPSLPTSAYSGGNIRDLAAREIWESSPEIAFTRNRTVDDLWGFCRSCYYADVCRAGCTWTTHTLFGRPGNNPYCHHRTLELSARGLRERIVRLEAPPGLPFDHGRFALVLEGIDGVALPNSEDSIMLAGADAGKELVTLTSGLKRKPEANSPTRKAQRLQLCRGCNRYIRRGVTACPHCGGDVRSLRLAYNNRLYRARRAAKRLAELLNIQ
jgi:radical SAM protein with 4Fe4S-binding SPASM domain